MKYLVCLLLSSIFLAVLASAQTKDASLLPSPEPFARDTVIAAQLSKSVDARKNKPGDRVEARTTMALLSHGKVVLPLDSQILGHVTTVVARSKQAIESAVGIAFDCVLMKGGRRLPLQAYLQAVAPPLNPFLSYDRPLLSEVPGGTGFANSEVSQPNFRSKEASSLLTLISDPVGPVSQPRAPAHLDGASGTLDQQSRGIFEMKGLSVGVSREANVFSSKTKNVHLDAGTQLILRIQ